MKLISYSRAGSLGFGAVLDDDVVDLTGVAGANALADLLADDGLDAAREQVARGGASFPLADCRLLPPIPQPTKILCVGVNYVAHAADAMAHVAGYACFNDASVRDWQFHTRQYGMGKNFLGSGGFGPWLVTADEVPDHHALRVRTVVSGDELQNESVDKLAFDIPYLI